MRKDNLKIDRTIIALALQNKQFAMELSNKASFEYFRPEIQWLYKAVMDHFTNPKFREIPTANVIEEYLHKNYSQTDFISKGIELFRNLESLEVVKEEFTWYLDKLKVRYNEQVQRSCASDMVNAIKDGGDVHDRVDKINDIMRQSVSTIDSINKKEAYKEGTLDESAKDRVNLYKAVEENPELAQGVMTGMTEFDRITNGLHGGELIIIGGRSSTGKSILMHNIALYAWLGGYDPLQPAPAPEDVKTGHHILYFSIEMPKENQERRLDACLAGVPYNDIRDGKLSTENKAKYFKVLKFQKQFPNKFHIVDMPRGVTVRDIELKHVEMEEKYGIKFGLTVSDYIGVMKPIEKQDSDWQNQGVVSEEFHEYARAYHIPVLTGVQINRPKDANNEEHSINRVARSDQIPSNANIILQIGCRGEDEHTRLDMPIYFIKNRDGEKTSFILIKNFPCMQTKDMMDESFGEDDDDDDY